MSSQPLVNTSVDSTAKQPAQESSTDLAGVRAELALAKEQIRTLRFRLSHDLFAPLQAIDGLSQVLLNHYQGELPEDIRQYMRAVAQDTREAAKVVADLLKAPAAEGYAEIEASHRQNEPDY